MSRVGLGDGVLAFKSGTKDLPRECVCSCAIFAFRLEPTPAEPVQKNYALMHKLPAKGTPQVYQQGRKPESFSNTFAFIGKMARPRGVEPPAFWFVGSASKILSAFDCSRIPGSPQ